MMPDTGRICSLLMVGMVLACLAATPHFDEVLLRDVSLDTPLVLDENAHYRLENVSVTGVTDCAALTLAGKINSVVLDRCTFGRVWAGEEGRAAALECAGAVIGRLEAADTAFFDAENQLASLKEGTFGRVTFRNCRFATSDAFLKQLYEQNPWRAWPPTTEFYNIQRLELLDNTYLNTTVLIHPSVKQVILRGQMPGLQVANPLATQVITLSADQRAENVPPPGTRAAAEGPFAGL